ncbi:MAG TPA: C4-type zinc ribbon domain-containing protein [Desulfuromonadaceae bacterium]
MKKRLEMLEQLQEIDLRIDTLKNSQAGLHGELNGIEQGLVAAREEVAGLEARIAQVEQEKTEREELLATEQENIRRSESHMKEIKTNKEFQAIGREIAAARKQAAELEEQLLQKIGQIEELKGESAAKSASVAELEQNTAQRSQEKQAEIAAIQQDIDTDLAQREEIAKQLPANLIKRYTLLREQRRGQALAIARDGYCLGCNMNLPPQLYNSLFRGDELISCPHCQRVLILKQQPQA